LNGNTYPRHRLPACATNHTAPPFHRRPSFSHLSDFCPLSQVSFSSSKSPFFLTLWFLFFLSTFYWFMVLSITLLLNVVGIECVELLICYWMLIYCCKLLLLLLSYRKAMLMKLIHLCYFRCYWKAVLIWSWFYYCYGWAADLGIGYVVIEKKCWWSYCNCA
jgi:hypothetical protein